ncbi:MAG: hypothetical protein BWY63_00634 [Chloroflexi bacterium ADurb.Bin360]|nr:MAG: hypothetical protein BWY63_00634 [Chloroflexi bacterium ADurb.Bin360]
MHGDGRVNGTARSLLLICECFMQQRRAFVHICARQGSQNLAEIVPRPRTLIEQKDHTYVLLVAYQPAKALLEIHQHQWQQVIHEFVSTPGTHFCRPSTDYRITKQRKRQFLHDHVRDIRARHIHTFPEALQT